MFRIFALIFALLASFARADDMPPPMILAEPICLEGQEKITDVSGTRFICHWPSDQPRFGCPDDWILVTRGGAFESCTPKSEPSVPSPVAVPEPVSLCGADEVIYYRLSGPQCAPRNADAGAACSSALDCDGTCLGDTAGQGICSDGPLSFGCTDFLNANGDPISICIE